MSLSLLVFTLIVGSSFVIAPPADALGSGVTFGAYAQPVGGESNIDAIVELERQLGRKLPLIRAFGDWDDGIGADKPLHRWARDGGRQVMVSVKPKRNNGQRVQWRTIANAQRGSTVYNEIADLADGARRFGEPIIVSFHHEPEAGPNTTYGDSSDFKAAFRRFAEIFRAEGADNVRFAWTMTSWSFEVERYNANDRRRAQLWYPGDDVVDFIAADPYNWNNCRKPNEPWTSLERTIEPFLTWSDRHPDKPLILAEWGSDEGTPGQKAQWLDDARAMFKSGKAKNRLAAVIYFHDDGQEEGWPNCDWWLDSSTETLDAARRLARDGFFRNPVPMGADPTPAPTTTTTTTTTTAAPRPTTTTTTTAAPRPTTTTTTAPRPTPKPGNFTCDGVPATIIGTNGRDVIVGTSGRDVIVARGGDDVIRAGGGNDLICANDGKDRIFGEAGSDKIFAGDHRDRVYGGPGNDIIYGGPSDDRLVGDDGRDRIYGGPGEDFLRGAANADTMFGNGGADTMLGSGGNDTLYGGSGNDTIDGNSGVDRCVGNGGQNIIGPGCN